MYAIVFKKTSWVSIFLYQKYGIDSIDKYNSLQKGVLDWQGNDTSVTPEDLFERITYSVNEVVDHIKIRLDTSIDGKSTITLKEDLGRSLLHEIGHRKYGKCFTFRPNVTVLALGVYYMRVQM